jgi:uncharacterized lipoprotein YajG
MKTLLVLATLLMLAGCASPPRDGDDWGAISTIIRHDDR